MCWHEGRGGRKRTDAEECEWLSRIYGFMDEGSGQSFQLIVGKALPVQMCTVKNEHHLSLELCKGHWHQTSALRLLSTLR